MGQPIPYRWLLLTGVVLTGIATGMFCWSTFAGGKGGPVFASGLGFLAASGVLACIVLGVYQVYRRCRNLRTPPLE